MSIPDERDLRQQLGSVLDAFTPPDPPVGVTVRKGKLILAGRSIGIVAGLAVAAGIGVGMPGLLHQPASQAVSRVRPTVMVEQVCPGAPGYAAGRPGQPVLTTVRIGELPAAELAAGGCAWLKP